LGHGVYDAMTFVQMFLKVVEVEEREQGLGGRVLVGYLVAKLRYLFSRGGGGYLLSRGGTGGG